MQEGKSFILGYKYLEPQVDYQIFCSFTDENETKYENLIEFSNLEVLLQPTIVMSSSPSSRNREDIIKFKVQVNSSYSILNRHYTLESINDDFTSTQLNDGFEFSIRRCAQISALELYIDIWAYPSTSPLLKSYHYFQIEFDANPIEFSMDLNKSHPYNMDIELEGILLFMSQCRESRKPFYTYTLNCEKSIDHGATFSTCQDPNSLFGNEQYRMFFEIPKTYFNVDEQLKLTLTVDTKGNVIATKSGIIRIENISTLILTVSCSESQECSEYTANKELTLYVTPHIDPGVPLKYSWSNNFGVPMTSSGNSTKIKFDTSSFGSEIFEVMVTIVESSFFGEGKIFFALNKLEFGSDLAVTPSTWSSGSAECNITASRLYSSLNAFFSNQVFYTTSAGMIAISGVVYQQFSFKKTLYSKAPNEKVIISVDSYNSMGAKGTSYLEIVTTSPQSSVVSSFASFVNEWPEIIAENLVDKAVEAALIANRINSLEASIAFLLKNVTSCTQAGCNCMGIDGNEVSCTIDSITLTNYNKYKRDFFVNLTEIYHELQKGPLPIRDDDIGDNDKRLLFEDFENSIPVLEYQEMLASILVSIHFITANPEILSQELANDVRIFLQNNQTSNVSSSYRELQETSKSLSNMIEYVKLTDCKCSTEFCKEMIPDTVATLEKITSSGIKKLFLDQEIFTHITSNFEIVASKSRVCNLASLSLRSSPQSPKVTISQSQVPTQDCEKEITIQSYSFPNLFDCSRRANFVGRNLAESKHTIMVKILDSDGQDIGNQITIQLEMPNGANCPTNCTITGLICTCPASVLSIESQLLGLFTVVEIVQPAYQDQDVSDLPRYELFWVVIGCLIFTIVMAVFFGIKQGASNFCIVKKYENRTSNSKFRQHLYMFISVHEALSLYLVKSNVISKSYRFIIYYVKILFFVLYTIILTESSEDDNADSLIKNHLTARLILLSYVIVLPVYQFILFLIKSEAKFIRKDKARTCFFFVIALIAAVISINMAFYTALKRGRNAQKVWGLNFVVTMIQEFVINPIIFFIISFFLMKTNSCTSLGKITLVDDGFEKIYKKVHFSGVKSIEGYDSEETERGPKKKSNPPRKI